jgi:hypothetical protein
MNKNEDAPFARARQARDFWRARSLDDYDVVLLLLPMEEDVTAALLSALEEKLAGATENGGQPPRALVLAAAPVRESGLYSSLEISLAEAENLLSLYCLYDFSDKFVVGSLDLPWGRKARNLLAGGVASGPDLIRALFFS